MRRRRDLLGGVLFIALAAALFYLLGGGGYPGGPDECIAAGDCYCEAIGEGRVAQPANAWSNAGFVLVGLAVLADVVRRDGPGLMARDLFFPRLYGALGIFLGIGSFAFHGTMRAWGGALDLISMYAYIAFFISYDLARIGRWSRGGFSAAFLLLTAVPAAGLAVIPPEHGKWVFAGLVGVALLVETALSYPGMRPWSPTEIDPARRPWFWAGLASFVAAFGVWIVSHTGGPWCAPHSLLQGHALWHLMTALSVWFFYRYFLSERVVVP
jgi:hypothetical protein